MALHVVRTVFYLKEVNQNYKDILGARSGEKSTKEAKYEENKNLPDRKIKRQKICTTKEKIQEY